METENKKIGAGLLLIAMSLAAFIWTADIKSEFFAFFISYLPLVIFCFAIIIPGWIKHKMAFFTTKSYLWLIGLILGLISAFSLNRDINIFEESTTWLQVYLILACILLMSEHFGTNLSGRFKLLSDFSLGLCLPLFFYFAVYLIPYYALGVLASFFFGMSLHVFVPVGFVIYITSRILVRQRQQKFSIAAFSCGFVVPLALTILFLFQWESVLKRITKSGDQAILEGNSQLPLWVQASQILPENGIAEKVLKCDLVYQTYSKSGNFWWGEVNRFDEVKKHDPLVLLATLFLGESSLSYEEKVKVLKTNANSRHQTQERLWNGDHLRTSHVITNVLIYPNLRMAYTEKVLSIKNVQTRQRWRNQEEAIYTFHLPEGSVVTSLSLWINGTEEKGYLTSKGKADTAYKRIVGVEARDPSVVHWQEGNTVSVRVFPCTPDEERRFKIGVTSPLASKGDLTLYENIYFQGPENIKADETVKVRLMDEVQQLVVPEFLERKAAAFYGEHSYTPDWQLSFLSEEIRPNNFSFQGESFSIKPFKKDYDVFSPEKVYLDINQSWTKDEFSNIMTLLSGKRVYAGNETLVRISEDNKEEVFENLHLLSYSLFPFHQIEHPESSLVITKASGISPTVAELKGSPFSENLAAYFKSHAGIRIWNIGSELSPYLKTLREFRVINYDAGDLNELRGELNKKVFKKYKEDENLVVVNDAAIEIVRTKGDAAQTAPDHLMRLFYYNSILRKTSNHYFSKDYHSEALVQDAQKAYVVSPLSSLVVLEKQEDYERFNIDKSKNSLDNASMNSAGAVPEPHEWLLIIAAVLFVAYLLWKNKTERAYAKY